VGELGKEGVALWRKTTGKIEVRLRRNFQENLRKEGLCWLLETQQHSC